VVTFALFSNGECSSPSNTVRRKPYSIQPTPINGPYSPEVSYEDNIRAQYAVLQQLGIKKVYAVVGFSMGGHPWTLLYYHCAITLISWAFRLTIGW